MTDRAPSSQFTWVPIHLETARKLREFRDRSGELISLIQRMQGEDLKVISVNDKDAAGHSIPLKEIDPFTFLANFNRGLTKPNRRALWDYLKNEWQLAAPVPEDFDGLPVANHQNSWMMPYLPKRDPDHVSLLWEFFEHILDAAPEILDIALMDRCLGKRKVGMAFLTMGMFWVRPDVWVATDGKNVGFAKIRGARDKPTNALEYRDWCQRVCELADGDVLSFSQEAHLWATSKSSVVAEDTEGELGQPFDELFDDFDSANEVLDVFREAIEILQESTEKPDRNLTTTFQIAGGKVRSLNINFGGWAVLRYYSVGKWLLLLPEEFCDQHDLEKKHILSNWRNDLTFCLAIAPYETAWEELIREAFHNRLSQARELFSDWKRSPMLRWHMQELFDLMVATGRERTAILHAGIDDEPPSATRPLWLLAPGEGGHLWQEWFRSGTAAIGWNETGDLTGLEGIEAFREAVMESYPDAGASKVGRMLHDFAVEMEPGDIVVAKEGRRAVLGWGIVSSDYRFDDSKDPFHHCRGVDWKIDQRTDLPESIWLPNKTLTGYHDRPPNRTLLDALEEIYEFAAEPETTAIETVAYTREDALRDLFVAPERLDRMMALLRHKKNLILQGAPGTGKTYIARRLAYLLMGARDEDRAPMIQFHQSTSYEDFIQGFRPDDEGRFLLRNGIFYDFCRAAAARPEDEKHVFIIDEINRGNLSKIFGELMLLIEPDKRGEDHAIRLVYGNAESEPFHVPPNVYLIGTMNTADRSLSLVDYALRRRFAFVEMEPGFESPAFAAALKRRGISMGVIDRVRSVMGALNAMIEEDAATLGRGYLIGHSFFTPTRNISDQDTWYREVIEFEILPLLEEYWADDPKGLAQARGVLGI